MPEDERLKEAKEQLDAAEEAGDVALAAALRDKVQDLADKAEVAAQAKKAERSSSAKE